MRATAIPARAGVIPADLSSVMLSYGRPRASGGDPQWKIMEDKALLPSPRERG